MYSKPAMMEVEIALATACCSGSGAGSCGGPPTPPPTVPYCEGPQALVTCKLG